MVGSVRAGLINVAMVPVGDPGNAADSNGYGAVSYAYQIGKYDVTTSQYAAFLNAVAAADPYGLYNSFMASGPARAGINQSGASGNYSYSVVAGHENFPVNWVSWGDAARFANWLQNGQPTDVEGPGTTESGAYTLDGATSTTALMAVTRNLNATDFIPTEDEWYKAAYYKGGGTNAGYWLFPTQNNSTPSNVLSATGKNNANFNNTDPTNHLTSVGAFAASPGPYGTFDQGGDVQQWNESAFDVSSRGVRGGSCFDPSFVLRSSNRNADNPVAVGNGIGFRVASVPEPSSVILLIAGIVVLTVAKYRPPRRLFSRPACQRAAGIVAPARPCSGRPRSRIMRQWKASHLMLIRQNAIIAGFNSACARC
jgi:formylglycine-generating enzyme required for sulfatase activity